MHKTIRYGHLTLQTKNTPNQKLHPYNHFWLLLVGMPYQKASTSNSPSPACSGQGHVQIGICAPQLSPTHLTSNWASSRYHPVKIARCASHIAYIICRLDFQTQPWRHRSILNSLPNGWLAGIWFGICIRINKNSQGHSNTPLVLNCVRLNWEKDRVQFI